MIKNISDFYFSTNIEAKGNIGRELNGPKQDEIVSVNKKKKISSIVVPQNSTGQGSLKKFHCPTLYNFLC